MLLEMFPSWDLVLWMVLISAVAAWFNGLVGLGYPLIATPLLALLTGVQEAILLTLLPTLTANLLCIGKGIEAPLPALFARFWPMVATAVVGVCIGTSLLLLMPESWLKLAVALMLVLYLLYSSLRRRTQHPATLGEGAGIQCGVGLCAGLVGGVTNLLAPPLIAYFLETRERPGISVPVMNFCFLAGKLTQLVLFASVAVLGLREWVLSLILALVAALALRSGIALRSKLAPQLWQQLLQGVLWMLALLLVIQALRAW